MGFQLIHSAGLRPHYWKWCLASGTAKSAYSRRVNYFNSARTIHEYIIVYWLSLYQRVEWKLWGYSSEKMEMKEIDPWGSFFFQKTTSRWEAQMVPGQLWNVNSNDFFGYSVWLATDLPLWNIEREQRTLRTSADSACSCSFSYPGFAVGAIYSAA